jgi:hypothetical protein
MAETVVAPQLAGVVVHDVPDRCPKCESLVREVASEAGHRVFRCFNGHTMQMPTLKRTPAVPPDHTCVYCGRELLDPRSRLHDRCRRKSGQSLGL